MGHANRSSIFAFIFARFSDYNPLRPDRRSVPAKAIT